jgi:site-specific DNA-methyltransferase (cytosine-N4-specific)
LLNGIDELGGVARPGELYDRIADKLNLDDTVRYDETTINGKRINEYERRVRWVRQTLVAKHLIANEQRGVWALTDRANAKLKNIVHGVIVTVFESRNGLYLWASAQDAAAIIERSSVDLVMVSPP